MIKKLWFNYFYLSYIKKVSKIFYMDKTVSYVNYQSPGQLNQIVEIFNKSILFLKKSNFNKKKEKRKYQKIPYSPSKIFFKSKILYKKF